MLRLSGKLAVLLAVPILLAAGTGRCAAQIVACYAPPAVTYYAPPVVSFYTPPAVSFYAPAVTFYPAPAVSYYAPPTTVTTFRRGILPWRREVTVATFGAPAVAAPAVRYYYSPAVFYR
jgi:hypothetical protein